ncbi:MAG: hypothetical protein LBP59_05590 [Planctomycetaceae bacterium]|jgi:signal-transduction protein with cAMP-binding, CBS, and nucleotidyltransferase domain|nr:hypothetical protein [Planctomycetaceae bacterium]
MVNKEQKDRKKQAVALAISQENHPTWDKSIAEQIDQQIKKTFKGENIMLSPIAQRNLEIGEAIGIDKGIKIGIEEGINIGIDKGVIIGHVEIIISILDMKFGEVSETVRDLLSEIKDVNSMKELARTAAKCDTFEEFCKKLKSTTK